MKRKIYNDLPLLTVECRCGEVGFGTKEYLSDRGWNVEKKTCRRCSEKKSDDK